MTLELINDNTGILIKAGTLIPQVELDEETGSATVIGTFALPIDIELIAFKDAYLGDANPNNNSSVDDIFYSYFVFDDFSDGTPVYISGGYADLTEIGGSKIAQIFLSNEPTPNMHQSSDKSLDIAYGLICHPSSYYSEEYETEIDTFSLSDDAWGWGEGSRETISEIQYPDGTIYDVEAKTIVNQNGGSLKTWTGTLEQYNTITTKDTNTIYNITNDTNYASSNIYTKDETDTKIVDVLSAMYPIGAIYIGTTSVCPMSAFFGVWQLVASDRVLQGAGSRGTVSATIDESLPNITGEFTVVGSDSTTGWVSNVNSDGAFYRIPVASGVQTYATTTKNTNSDTNRTGFNASLISGTYQDNAPVQQDAYIVNIWERVA